MTGWISSAGSGPSVSIQSTPTKEKTKERTMNVLLWVLQIGLALLYLAGGAYKTFKFDELANQMHALPRSGWRALGVLEMVGAVLLIVPAAARWMPVLTPLAAAALVMGRHWDLWDQVRGRLGPPQWQSRHPWVAQVPQHSAS